jgi:PAS domain S-box
MKLRTSVTIILCLCLRLAAGETPLRVVIDDNYPPYSFRDETGTLQGICIDYWHEWERVTGERVEVIGTKWETALDTIKSGNADVIDTLFPTEERKQQFDFMPSYASIEVPVFVHRSITGIRSLEDLKGLQIAVKAGDACIGYFHQAGLVNLVIYDSYSEIVQHAKDQDFRVFCMDKPASLYLMARSGIERDYSETLILYTGKFCRAVQKGNIRLLDRVQRGFDGMDPERRLEIERRWMGGTADIPVNYRFIVIPAAIILFIILWLVLFITLLRQRVAQKTRELEFHIEKLEASERRNRAIIQALPDLYFIVDRNGTYLDGSFSDERLINIPEGGLVGNNISAVFNPEQVAILLEEIRLALENGGIRQIQYELVVPAGRRTYESRLVAIDGNSVLYIARDITDRLLHEELLRKSLREKEILIKEIHHRVKNNLQVISSLIALQSEFFANDGDKALVQETQQRIQSMAQLHEMLYQSKDFVSIDISSYLGGIIDELNVTYFMVTGRIGIVKKIDCIPVNLEVALPLGLIVNELVSNAFKYAFPSFRAGIIEVSLKENGDDMVLTVRDDGVGISGGITLQTAGSLGFVLIRSLTQQLGGTAKLTVDHGTCVEIVFHRLEGAAELIKSAYARISGVRYGKATDGS